MMTYDDDAARFARLIAPHAHERARHVTRIREIVYYAADGAPRHLLPAGVVATRVDYMLLCHERAAVCQRCCHTR